MSAAETKWPLHGPDWLERDRNVIDGLDHLGIQVVSINLYGSLLPGITNVTDRARYYSFYPWVLHRYAQRGASESSRNEWRSWIRRLDYAFALASARAEAEEPAAGTAVVGINAARRALKDKASTAVIDVIAATEVNEKGKAKAKAYFQSPEGGLGQYYKGALQVLGIAAETKEFRDVDWQLTANAGKVLAKAVDDTPGFNDLLEGARSGSLTVGDLETIGGFIHPAAIPKDSTERQVLTELILGRGEAYCEAQLPEERQWRQDSLSLLLDFVGAHPKGVASIADDFRWGVLEGKTLDNQLWQPPIRLKPAMQAWAGYQRNDLMNFALETLFWVSLRRLDEADAKRERLGPYDLARHVSQTILTALEDDGVGYSPLAADTSLSDALHSHRHELDPASPNIKQAGSMRSWARQVELATKRGKEDETRAAAMATHILLRIATDTRIDRERPFGGCPAATPIFQAYEVHLRAWAARCEARKSERLDKFLADLILDWILFRHLRVATRKAAAQGVSTFKFRPEEGELVCIVDDPPKPVLTNPRLRQAGRILADLGYLETRSKRECLTDEGRALLDSLDV